MMMRRAALAGALALPLALLTSTGCGIFTLPFEGPKIAIVNMKLISITSDIVNEEGQPLDEVTASVTLHSLATNVFFPETEETKTEEVPSFDKTFSYTTFGHYAVVVMFKKPGYQSRIILYSLEDHPRVFDQGNWGSRLPLSYAEADHVNTIKVPRSRIVLTSSH